MGELGYVRIRIFLELAESIECPKPQGGTRKDGIGQLYGLPRLSSKLPSITLPAGREEIEISAFLRSQTSIYSNKKGMIEHRVVSAWDLRSGNGLNKAVWGWLDTRRSGRADTYVELGLRRRKRVLSPDFSRA